MKPTPLWYPMRRVLFTVLPGLIILIGMLVNIPVTKAATTMASAYYPETITEKVGNDTYQYKVHEYPALTQTDNVSGAYNYPSQSVNLGWTDVYVNGVFQADLKGTVDQWDKDQGSQYLSRNSDVNITDSGSFFQPDPMVGSDNGWWPNDGTAWNTVKATQPDCTLTSGPVEAPWGDLQATVYCSFDKQYYLYGYIRSNDRYFRAPWSDPRSQAFGHAFWQQTTGITNMYQSLHTSDTPAVAGVIRATPTMPTMPAMPTHFGPSTFSDPAFLASYNAARQGLTSALHPASSSKSNAVKPAILFSLTVALGLIAVGAVMAIGGTLLGYACNAQTNVKCLGEHTKAWERVGYVIAILGTVIIAFGTLHPELPAYLYGTSAAVAGGATAVEGLELTGALSGALSIADTTAAIAAEEAEIAGLFNSISFA